MKTAPMCVPCGILTEINPYTGKWKCPTSNHRGNTTRAIRMPKPRVAAARGYRGHKEMLCASCGFVPFDPCQLDVDHIDGNHQNHDADNLMTLCANCHRLHIGRTSGKNGVDAR